MTVFTWPGGLVASDSIQVFNARFAAKRCVERLQSAHPDAFEQADGREIACIGDPDHAHDAGLREQQGHHQPDGLGRETVALPFAIEGEADFGLRSVLGEADSDVADEVAGVTIRDRNLQPLPARERRSHAHRLDERRRFCVSPRLPALVAPDFRIVPVALEVSEVRRRKPSQHDPVPPQGK